MSERFRLSVEPELRELVPGFLENRRRDLEILRRALGAGDLAAVREVGQNIRCFSRVLGIEELTELGEALRVAADEQAAMRIAYLESRLADYLQRAEVSD